MRELESYGPLESGSDWSGHTGLRDEQGRGPIILINEEEEEKHVTRVNINPDVLVRSLYTHVTDIEAAMLSQCLLPNLPGPYQEEDTGSPRQAKPLLKAIPASPPSSPIRPQRMRSCSQDGTSKNGTSRSAANITTRAEPKPKCDACGKSTSCRKMMRMMPCFVRDQRFAHSNQHLSRTSSARRASHRRCQRSQSHMVQPSALPVWRRHSHLELSRAI